MSGCFFLKHGVYFLFLVSSTSLPVD